MRKVPLLDRKPLLTAAHRSAQRCDMAAVDTPDQRVSLLSLNDDVLRTILASTCARSVCNAALTCSRLRRLASEEEGGIWEALCQALLDDQAEQWAHPHAQVEDVKAALRLPGYRSMYRGLLTVGGSPLGLWWSTAESRSALRRVIPGVISISVSEQSSGAGPPHYIIAGTAHEQQLTISMHRPLFKLTLCPVKQPPSRPSTSSASAAGGSSSSEVNFQPTGLGYGEVTLSPDFMGRICRQLIFDAFPDEVLQQALADMDDQGSDSDQEGQHDSGGSGSSAPASQHGTGQQGGITEGGQRQAEQQQQQPQGSPTASGASAQGQEVSGAGSSGQQLSATPLQPPSTSSQGRYPPGQQPQQSGDQDAMEVDPGGTGATAGPSTSAAPVQQAAFGDDAGSQHDPSGLLPRKRKAFKRRLPRKQSDLSFSAKLRVVNGGRSLVLEVTLALTRADQDAKTSGSGLPFVGAAAGAVWGRLRQLLWAKTLDEPERAEAWTQHEEQYAKRVAKGALTQTLTFTFDRVDSSHLVLGRAMPPAAARPLKISEGGAQVAVQALQRLVSSLWHAEYGSHGSEIIQLRTWAAGTAGPERCPFPPPCVEGFKLQGDPNVPSGNTTFAANLARLQLGRYDGRGVVDREIDGRPILMFSSQGMALIALEMRPVAARFAGVGQINQFPGTWNPQWESTEIILYEDEDGIVEEGFFSVLWLDLDMHHMHLTDFRLWGLDTQIGLWAPGKGHSMLNEID